MKIIVGMKNVFKIKAVYEDDLKGVLGEVGLWKPLLAGEVKCPCGETTTHENLAAMMKVDGKIELYHSIVCVPH